MFGHAGHLGVRLVVCPAVVHTGSLYLAEPMYQLQQKLSKESIPGS